jgi:hypothetical protein
VLLLLLLQVLVLPKHMPCRLWLCQLLLLLLNLTRPAQIGLLLPSTVHTLVTVTLQLHTRFLQLTAAGSRGGGPGDQRALLCVAGHGLEHTGCTPASLLLLLLLPLLCWLLLLPLLRWLRLLCLPVALRQVTRLLLAAADEAA